MIAPEAHLTSAESRRMEDASRLMAPWERDRFRLVTPLEMIRFFASLVVILTRDLTGEMTSLIGRIVRGEGEVTLASGLGQPNRDGMTVVLNNLLERPEEMPLSHSLRRKVERLLERVQTDSTLTLTQAEVLLKELLNDIIMELSSPYFLMIPTSRRELYDQRSPPMSSLVEAAFPEAQYDIEAANRCLALDEWTACVFHLMRVLEHGLRDMATRLEIPMVATLDKESWGPIIAQMESEIRRREKLPKTDPLRADLPFYSEAATNFRYFKNAWRDQVSHAKSRYDERQASKIWEHVRSFMQALASDGTAA